MGRGKIEIKKIENSTSRQITFSKRRGGLLKKAHELGVLCDVQIGLIIFSNTGKMFEFSNPDSSMVEIIERYKRRSKNQSLINERYSHEQAMYSEMIRMQHENERLLMHLRRLTGEDLSGLNLEDLGHLESQLEISVANVKNRKHQLILQQSENLRRKVENLEDENKDLTYMVQQYQQHLQQHAAVTDTSGLLPVFGQQYGFLPDEVKSNMLHFQNLSLLYTQHNLHEQHFHGHDLQL